jgi:hypothetical protein
MLQKLPIFDDLMNLAATVVDLRTKDAAVLKIYVDTTVQNLAGFLKANGLKPLTDVTAQITALAGATDLSKLKTEMNQLTLAMARIGGAVASGDLSASATDITAANGALDTLLPRITKLNTNLFSGQVDTAQRALERLPIDTERYMRRVLQAVEPVAMAQMFKSLGDTLADAIHLNSPEQLAKDVGDLLAPVMQGLDVVNVIPIREPMLVAIDGVNSAADSIDQLLGQVAAQTALLFNQVNQLLASVDTASVVAPIHQAIVDFQNTLQQQASALFGPLHSALADGVSKINDAVSGFKADDIINALKDAIDKLVGVLDSPDVKNAIGTIHQAIDTAVQQIQNISFTPVTGQVIAAIDDVTKILKSIDPHVLSTEVKLALKAAVAILPGDLKPITDPLVSEFDHLIDVGPKPLLVSVKGQPAKLLNQVKAFSPANLIGDQLSKPFQDVIGNLEQFKPSSLLAPVQQALNGIKDQVRQKADPGQLLKPLEDLFNQLLAQFDKLKPEAVIKPLNDQVQAVINQVLAALHVDDVLHAFDDILAPLQNIRDTALAVKGAMEKVVALASGLADPETQIRGWLQPIFDHVDQISDIASLQPSFDKLTASVNLLKANAMRSSLSSVLTPLSSALNNLNPQSSLAALVAAYGSVHPDALAALSPSAQKSDVQVLLGRFNPIAPDFSRPFDGLNHWQQEITRDQKAFENLMTHWDLRFHSPGRPLADFIHSSITSADLKAILKDALENEVVQPLAHLLRIVQTLAAGVQPWVTKVAAVIDTFEHKLDDLLLGPQSLGGLRDAINHLITRLHNINFQFVVTQMNTTFQTVRGKLTAVSPTAIRTLVEKAFNDALNLLDISQLLPKDQLDAIDADYQKIIDNLKKFDPKALIIDVVQPEFEAKIVPLLAAFDITAVLQAALDRLEGLKGELQTELDKTNQSYKDMLNAVPSISLDDVAGAVVGAIGDIAGGIGGSIGF